MPQRLPNYLRTHRKRAGLSQDHVAVLLGCRSGTKVSRYERFVRVPTLRTALAFEAVFHAPVRELFAGLYEEVEKIIERRRTRTDQSRPARVRQPARKSRISPRTTTTKAPSKP